MEFVPLGDSLLKFEQRATRLKQKTLDTPKRNKKNVESFDTRRDSGVPMEIIISITHRPVSPLRNPRTVNKTFDQLSIPDETTGLCGDQRSESPSFEAVTPNHSTLRSRPTETETIPHYSAQDDDLSTFGQSKATGRRCISPVGTVLRSESSIQFCDAASMASFCTSSSRRHDPPGSVCRSTSRESITLLFPPHSNHDSASSGHANQPRRPSNYSGSSAGGWKTNENTSRWSSTGDRFSSLGSVSSSDWDDEDELWNFKPQPNPTTFRRSSVGTQGQIVTNSQDHLSVPSRDRNSMRRYSMDKGFLLEIERNEHDLTASTIPFNAMDETSRGTPMISQNVLYNHELPETDDTLWNASNRYRSPVKKQEQLPSNQELSRLEQHQPLHTHDVQQVSAPLSNTDRHTAQALERCALPNSSLLEVLKGLVSASGANTTTTTTTLEQSPITFVRARD
jgi:hypothetical protein